MADFNVPPVNRWCELKADAEEYLRNEFEKVNLYAADLILQVPNLEFSCSGFWSSTALWALLSSSTSLRCEVLKVAMIIYSTRSLDHHLFR